MAASRRLAQSLHQGLRAQRAISAVKPKPTLTRSLATPVSYGSTTESTTLNNGFTVSRHPPINHLGPINSEPIAHCG